MAVTAVGVRGAAHAPSPLPRRGTRARARAAARLLPHAPPAEGAALRGSAVNMRLRHDGARPRVRAPYARARRAAHLHPPPQRALARSRRLLRRPAFPLPDVRRSQSCPPGDGGCSSRSPSVGLGGDARGGGARRSARGSIELGAHAGVMSVCAAAPAASRGSGGHTQPSPCGSAAAGAPAACEMRASVFKVQTMSEPIV